MPDVLGFLARIGEKLPGVERVKIKPTLGIRLVYTGIALILYLFMSAIPLYGIEHAPRLLGNLPQIVQIVFAMSGGTLAQLGIGPIVTAGLIMQILVGSKLLTLDLSKAEERRKFTLSQKTLALIIAGVEAGGFVIVGSNFWTLTGPNPVFDVSASFWIRFLVWFQLVFATYLIMLLDESLQMGWGIGSGISLFILAGVARDVINRLFSPLPVSTSDSQPFGFIPYLIWAYYNGDLSIDNIMIRASGTMYLPNLIGLIALIVVMFLLIYLQRMKVYIPVTMQRLRGVRTRVPLQFLYVTNLPVLLISILYSDLFIFYSIASGNPTIANVLGWLMYYLRPISGFYELFQDPGRVMIYVIIFTVLAVLFGLMWIEVAGLNPSGQAERLIQSGLEIPGLRRNPKILEAMLARYIYPLTILSSLIVVAIVIVADIFMTYGTGVGILLAIGIIEQFYTIIVYERALEAYPILKRILGEA
ncbi:MAG: preprotein translocase subunit SecY [Sulfolobales archaeon]